MQIDGIMTNNFIVCFVRNQNQNLKITCYPCTKEDEVVEYMQETNKHEKEKLYEKLRNLGNHLHNIKVLKSGEGLLAVTY